jgi:hypothetical protein
MMFEASRAPFPESGEPVAPDLPVSDPRPEIEGGGGIMLDALRDEPWRTPDAPNDVPLPPTAGGGGTTLDVDCGRPLAELPKPEAALPTEGGGGITLALSEVPCPPLGDVRELPAPALAATLGGGGTTSCVPKSLPMIVLTKDPLAACVGGGGIIFGADEGMPPLSRRRRLLSEFADGGGATTDGAGMLSLAMRPLSRSGAETGGGTTATLFICTREGETACATSDGAGPTIVPFSDGAERA